MTLSVRRHAAACTALVVLAPIQLWAQASAFGAPTDSAAAVQNRGATNPWPQHGWISAGAGIGSYPYGSLDGVATGWYSVGPFATGVRLGTTGQWIGEQRSDQAFLVGARTRGSRTFVLGAIGTAKVASSRSCDGPCGELTRGSSTEMAYAFEAHANVPAIGVGATMFGVLGPASVRYNAFALTLDLGWFGPW